MAWNSRWNTREMRWIWLVLLLAFALTAGMPAVASAGIRAFGMGGAYTAVADDVAAVFWNPAGLMQITESSVTALLSLPTDGTDGYAGCISYLERDSGYGAGALSWYHSRHSPVAAPGNSKYKTHDLSYAVARPLGEFALVGGTIHYLRQQEAEQGESATRWVGDVAALLRLSQSWQVGLTLLDVYGLVKDSGGVGVDQNGKGVVMAGFAFVPNERITLALDGYDLLNREQTRSFRLGGEYKASGNVALRGGFQRGLDNDWQAWSCGAGVDVEHWKMEYAYLGGDYNGIHTLGVSYQF